MNKTNKLYKNSSWQKKMISGGLACTLLFSGATPVASAAEESVAVETAISQQQVGVVDLFVQKRLESAASEIAAYTGKDLMNVQERLNNGLSIAEATGMSANALLNAMLPTFNLYIIEATYSQLSEDQIAQLQKEGQTKLMEALSTPGYAASNDVVSKVENNLKTKIDAVLKSNGFGASDENASDLQIVAAKRILTIIEYAVDESDLPLTDVLVQLELGNSLADAARMDTADLSIQLQQLVNEDIDHAASVNGTNAATIEEAKSDAANLIDKLVTEKIWIASPEHA